MTAPADRELLEMAAKAAGIAPVLCYESRRNLLRIGDRSSYHLWNPLTDDGDALRLAVKLGLNLYTDRIDRWVACGAADTIFYDESKFGGSCDPYAATRRSIVLAAAKIGSAL